MMGLSVGFILSEKKKNADISVNSRTQTQLILAITKDIDRGVECKSDGIRIECYITSEMAGRRD